MKTERKHLNFLGGVLWGYSQQVNISEIKFGFGDRRGEDIWKLDFPSEYIDIKTRMIMDCRDQESMMYIQVPFPAHAMKLGPSILLID